MEQGTMVRLVAAATAIIAFAFGATRGDLVNLGIASAVAVAASIGIWFQTPNDFGNWTKLRDHLLLSIPLACLSIVGGLVLYAMSVVHFDAIFGLFIGLFTTASVLEAKLNMGR